MSLPARLDYLMLPLRNWRVLDHDVLNCLVGEDEPDRKLLLAVQKVRLIVEPAAAPMTPALATGKDRKRVHVTVAAKNALRDRATQTNLSKTYFDLHAGANATAVRDVSLQVPAGEFVSIVGLSGCGKTKLLNSWKKYTTERTDKNI